MTFCALVGDVCGVIGYKRSAAWRNSPSAFFPLVQPLPSGSAVLDNRFGQFRLNTYESYQKGCTRAVPHAPTTFLPSDPFPARVQTAGKNERCRRFLSRSKICLRPTSFARSVPAAIVLPVV